MYYLRFVLSISVLDHSSTEFLESYLERHNSVHKNQLTCDRKTTNTIQKFETRDKISTQLTSIHHPLDLQLEHHEEPVMG